MRSRNGAALLSALCWALLSLTGFVHANAQSAANKGADTLKAHLLPASRAELQKRMQKAYVERKSCKPEAPIEVRLDLAQPPRLGQPVQVVFSVLPIEGLQNAEVSWDVADGVQVANGQRRVVPGLKLTPNNLVQFPLTIRLSHNGEYEVAASIIERGKGYSFGRRMHIHFLVTPSGIRVRDMRSFAPSPPVIPPQPVGPKDKTAPSDPATRHFKGSNLMPLESPHSDDRTDGVKTLAGGTARVIGHFYYRHHDGSLHAAWNSVAQIWDRDSWSGDDLLAEVIINWDGSFDSGNFDNTNDTDPWPFYSSQDVYVRWLSRNGRVNVVNYDNNNTLIVGDVNVGDNISDGTHDIGGWFIDTDGPGSYADDGWESAFEICETMSLEWLHYNALGTDISHCTARWKPGGSDGTYYNGNWISLLDGDQYDRSVVLHEYGHHVMDFVKGGFPPGSGGGHSWFGSSNGGLAWSEGWATYSGQTVLNDPVYVDTPGVADSANASINIEQTTGNWPHPTAGTTTEASVISSLWDVYDSLGDDPHPHDYLALGTDEIFENFRNGGTFNNMRDYLNSFMSRWGYRYSIRWNAHDHNIQLGVLTSLAASSVSGVIGQTVTVSATLRRVDNNNTISGELVWFNIGGNWYVAVTNFFGVASIAYAIPDWLGTGTKTITIEHDGNSTYDASNTTALLFVSRANTHLNVPSVSGAVGQTVTLSGTLTRTSDGASLGSKTLDFYVNGGYVDSAATDSTGLATRAYVIPEGLGTGGRTIQVNFGSDGLYNSTSATATLTIKKSNTKIVVPNVSGTMGTTVALQATLTRTSDGATLSGKALTFKVGTKIVDSATTNKAGVATVNYTIPNSAAPGTKVISAAFAGDGLYNATTGTGTLTAKSNTQLKAADVAGVIGQKVTLSATLRRTSDGAGVSGKHVTFKVNGAVVGTGTTNASGFAKQLYAIPEALGVGAATITAEFAGDSLYNASSDTSTLTVRKASTKLDVLNATGHRGHLVTLTATLTRTSDNAKLARKTVTFQALGATWNGTTNAAGQASVTITIPAGTRLGVHVLIGTFAGDTLYNASSDTAALKVVP